MKKIVLGTLAHVDAGKTTLAETLLFTSGSIRSRGRVDEGNTHLDTDPMERERGITIFSNCAPFTYGSSEFTILDTPGHMEFSSEAERVFPVLDYAVLVISGTDGVQAHTETLWRLLQQYQVPTFIFVSKMDISHRSPSELMTHLKQALSPGCIDFRELSQEDLACTDEAAMEEYLQSGVLSSETIAELIRSRRIFPVYFGSGLHGDGIQEFLKGLDLYTVQPAPGDSFGAKAFQIRRDHSGARLTFIKLTGGSVSVRDSILYVCHGEQYTEKISQIRRYSGERFNTLNEAGPGDIVALCGLDHTLPGLGLGTEIGTSSPILEAVMTCSIAPSDGSSVQTLLSDLRILTEEDPLLNVQWNDRMGEIQIQIRGNIQSEVLKDQILRRFGIDTVIGTQRILYRETIASPVEGAGHFEPLRHYAEVHLLMSPLPRGSGLVFDSDCSEDLLDRNWQRLILTHLEEKHHLGVLTGSPITDMRITLIAGKAHVKHTEGGDFRQATYRAVRQGLMKADCILLEPYYAFSITVPQEYLGRIINDIKMIKGTISDSETRKDGSSCVILGRAPVDLLTDYMNSIVSITRGRGHISVWPDGYEPCARSTDVVNKIGYDPERDTDNPADSVFCSHGSGITVPWKEADQHMHIDTGIGKDTPEEIRPVIRYHNVSIDDAELEAIMEREFGPIRRPVYSSPQINKAPDPAASLPKKQYLIIDGYNIIYSWDELKTTAQADMDLARGILLDIMANYHGFTQTEIVLVFDAYRVRNLYDKAEDYHGIHVVYTKQGESADAYIQKLSRDIGRNYSVRVVTSDSLIQLSALSAGVLRVSTREFHNEVQWTLDQIEAILQKNDKGLPKTRLEELHG